ncbi:hypothetical protein [Nocardia nova]|uniref:hypothetical protein n=1 Tax=Nocardia nova TaxID=37330 RepID=UPI00189553FC|nr:hypothetical protein [Nocardia nova]MBF6144210.1 hypothetical protein [Nocardia nova]
MATDEPLEERTVHDSTSSDPLMTAEQFLTDSFIESLLEGMAEKGQLVIENRPVDEILTNFMILLYQLKNSFPKDTTKIGPSVRWTMDHREDILNNARSALSDDDIGLSILLYGTWCEHQVNLLLTTAFERLGYSETTSTTLIRNCNMWTKVTALWEIARLRTFDTDTLRILKSLTDNRNGYVHYKWKYVHDLEFDHTERYREVLSSIDTLIDFMMAVEEDLTWNGRKDEILAALRATRGSRGHRI